MGTFEKVIALLGLAAGAYDSFKYGGPNVYLEQLNKAVDDDIKEQSSQHSNGASGGEGTSTGLKRSSSSHQQQQQT